MIVELKQNDEVSTLFVKYSGDDTIATGAKFKQKFTAFRFVTTRLLQLDDMCIELLLLAIICPTVKYFKVTVASERVH